MIKEGVSFRYIGYLNNAANVGSILRDGTMNGKHAMSFHTECMCYHKEYKETSRWGEKGKTYKAK